MKRPESLETVPVQGYTMSDAEFERFAAANDVLRIERDEQKQIFIMAPISLEGGEWENSFRYQPPAARLPGGVIGSVRMTNVTRRA